MTAKSRTITEMNYNKITLTFQDKNENLFLSKYFTDSVFQFRIAFILVIILYGTFGYLDSRMVPAFANLFHIIRYVFVIPLLTAVLLISYTKIFQKVWQGLLFVSFIVAGTGISIMTMLVPENYAYYAGMMLIFSAGYFFIKLRFFLATIAGWTTLLIFNIGAIFYSHLSGIILINNNFFFISANLIGMFAAYNIERYARRNFFLNQKLDIEKLFVEELNKNLEKTVTERTRELVIAKEHAEESDRLKTAFLYNMSHEIRTPMNSILGFADLLKEPGLTGAEQQNYIRIIGKSGERMLNVINDIVEISKLDAGVMKIDEKLSNINEQIEYLYTFFKPEIEGKGLKFFYKYSLPPKEAVIKTDREKLYAILTYLIKNAIKYTSEGAIEFGYVKKGDFLEFYLKDTGIGIPNNRQEAIFERFIQADIEDKNALQGAGLGLTITKSYIEMLGGKIWVESEEGQGSTFYFTLPYNYVPEKESPDDIAFLSDDEVHSDHPNSTGLKILIVEDDETSDMLLELIVKVFGKEILKAKTGIEAVEICRNRPEIELILMDIRMPEMGGYEATRQIRQFNKNVVIIAQTAYGLSGDKEKAIEAGCNDYISKPINKTRLLALIQKHINK